MTEKSNRRWLLPDGVQETLPPDALAVESLRHEILDIFHRWGYDLVMPAMIEYMDSLLTGTAHSLDTRTFALVDQLSGKQMGVRSDMTPQVARIDAHLLADDARHHRVTRLCYCGHLLHAIGDGINSSRTPLQIGAEIFGSDAIGADVEVVSLMVATLHAVGLKDMSLDIGHVGIFRSLVKNTGLDHEQENRLFDMLQRKSIPDLQVYLQQLPLDDHQREQFYQLALLNGDASVIDEARRLYSDATDDLFTTLDAMASVVRSLQQKYPDTLIHCDLSELRGYSYHTGLVFAAFLPGQGREIARGGRYDDVGKVFGNARPATGFSADLLNLYQLRGLTGQIQSGILAPDHDDPALAGLIERLRAEGERVVIDLTRGRGKAADQQCDREAVLEQGTWVIKEVK
ncbi:MAG: ATP phosphoribosyltransferase regulatory subunit [Gammaproteobacteria bacterium]|nr:ATP phosphoribosyltransferase regulatory subunit [Gammaproteobacteria bacterium]